MDRLLSQAVLKDGTRVDVRLIEPPEAGWADRMDGFLRHKGMPWRLHWQDAFAGRCDVLETRFYILAVDGEPISNIMTAETDGIGIFGHVFTRPAWREKGAASILMRTVCDDFAQRDGTVLYLGTQPDGMPRRLYAKFGFEGLPAGAGLMRLLRRPERLEARFDPRHPTVRPLRWGDWPLLQCLFLQLEGDDVRNMGLKRFGPSDMEGPFLALQERLRNVAGARAAVATGADGMALGLATAVPLDAAFTDYMLVDIYAHRAAEAALDPLLRALQLPEGTPLLSVVEVSSASRRRVLEAAGFCAAGHLPEALKVEADRRTLLLMIRASRAASKGV